MTAIARARGLAAKIDAATPAHRDRTVDALRALAIVGVILGHWLVTALVVTHGHGGTGGHSDYFKPGGIALRNLARIALGDPAGVTR